MLNYRAGGCSFSICPVLESRLKPLPKVFVLVVGILVGCVKAQPATDTGGLTTATAAPSGPSTPATPSPTPASSPAGGVPTPTPTPSPGGTGLAYTPDLQPIFASDCLVCHSDRNPLGRYSMSSYAAVMRAVTAGSASSSLVRTTQANGSMYRYWSGDRQAKAAMTRDWVVTYRAAQSR